MDERALERLRALVAPERLTLVEREGPPLACLAPASEEEWRECLRLAGREGWRVRPVSRAPAPARALHASALRGLDLLLSTEAWNGIVAYEPDDGTLTARSGSSMEELAVRAAAGGHHVSPDVAHAARTSLGAVLGAGRSGLDRLRYGSVRENVLGTRALLADGSIARSGGRLVKNVTGYDLHRLWCGSRGSLCVVLEASLRLHPLPRERRSLELACASLSEAFALARELARSPARPLALCIEQGARGPVGLYLALGGREETVAYERADLEARLAGTPLVRSDTGASFEERWRALRDRERPDGPWVELWCLPSELERTLEAVCERAEPLDLVAHPTLGRAVVALAQPCPAETLGRDLPARARLRTHGVAGSGLQPPLASTARTMMERLRRSYDPRGTFGGPLPDAVPSS